MGVVSIKMNESNTVGGEIEDKCLLRTVLAPLGGQIDIDQVVDQLLGEFVNIRGLLEATPDHLRSMHDLPIVVIEHISNIRQIVTHDIIERLEDSLQMSYPRPNQISGRQELFRSRSDESPDHVQHK